MTVYVDRSALLSRDGLYRYTLGRVWDGGMPSGLTYIGLNPSTADHKQDDATVRRCRRFAERFGFGGFTMVNLFAYRATQPNELRQALGAGIDVVGPHNNQTLLDQTLFADLVIPCWGANAEHWLDREREVVGMLESMCADKLKCFGRSRDGHPLHPLRLPAAIQLRSWDT